MKVTVLAAAIGVASASQILPRAPAAPAGLCCFTLTASAAELGSAVIEEDTIGQNRAFSTYPDGYYCINPAEPGKLYDQGGRTCIISKITQQFQCTQGLTTEVDFTVSDDGDFQADGSDKFWACRAGGNGNNYDGSYLIYSDKKENPYGCVAVDLSTTGNKCAGKGDEPTAGAPYGNSTTTAAAAPTAKPVTSIPIFSSAGFVTSTTTTIPGAAAASGYVPFDIFSSPAPSASGYAPVDNDVADNAPTTVESPVAESAPTATAAPTEAALPPTTLSPGNYAAPALIIPVSPETPDAAFGTQYVASITPGNSTLFSFDIPADWTGSSCSVIFTFPEQAETAFPGAWKFAGRDGKVAFSELYAPILESTTFATTPAVKTVFGETTVVPGGEYRISTENCKAGTQVVIQATAVGETVIQYFQATGPKAVGVWITRV